MIIPCSVRHWRFWSGDQLTLVVVQPDGVVVVDIACTRTVLTSQAPVRVRHGGQ